jgi:hypothetical protein
MDHGLNKVNFGSNCQSTMYNQFNDKKDLISNLPVEKDIELCAIRLHSTLYRLSILSVYRSPAGNFANFFI